MNEDNTEHTEVTPDNYYTLILEPIEDDKKLQFVYYYGCWYTLAKGYEKTKLLGGDIRQLRDNEYILVDEYYDSFEEIENPIPNGVYWISSYAVDDENLDLRKLKTQFLMVYIGFLHTRLTMKILILIELVVC